MILPKRESKNTIFVGIGFQIVAFTITLTILTCLFYYHFKHFKAYDSHPVFFQWPEEITKSAKAIQTGLHIRNFTEFDTAKNNFVLTGILWFKVDPNFTQWSDLKKFRVLNGELLKVSEEQRIAYKNNIFIYFDVQLSFKCPLDYRLFPMDDHHIAFGLTNRDIANTTIFSASQQDITFSNDFYLPGWIIVKRTIETGYATISLAEHEQLTLKHPRIIFSLDCKRIDPCDIITMILVLMLILLLVVSTLSSLAEQNLHIIALTIIALISYRFVVESLAPPHVRYFMISDYLFLSAVLALIFGLFSVLMINQRQSTVFVKKMSIIATYTIFIIGSIIAVM